MIGRIVVALVVAILVGLGLVALLGPLLVAMHGVPPATIVGNFFVQYGWVLGILIGLLYFFSGTTWGTGLFRRTPPNA